MTFVEICQQASEVGLQIVRERKGEPNQYDAKPWPGGNKRGWFLLDTFTASAVNSVYNAISDTNKAKLNTLSHERIVDICFSLVGK